MLIKILIGIGEGEGLVVFHWIKPKPDRHGCYVIKREVEVDIKQVYVNKLDIKPLLDKDTLEHIRQECIAYVNSNLINPPLDTDDVDL